MPAEYSLKEVGRGGEDEELTWQKELNQQSDKYRK